MKIMAMVRDYWRPAAAAAGVTLAQAALQALDIEEQRRRDQLAELDAAIAARRRELAGDVDPAELGALAYLTYVEQVYGEPARTPWDQLGAEYQAAWIAAAAAVAGVHVDVDQADAGELGELGELGEPAGPGVDQPGAPTLAAAIAGVGMLLAALIAKRAAQPAAAAAPATGRTRYPSGAGDLGSETRSAGRFPPSGPDPAPVATEPGCQHPGCVLSHPHNGPAVLQFWPAPATSEPVEKPEAAPVDQGAADPPIAGDLAASWSAPTPATGITFASAYAGRMASELYADPGAGAVDQLGDQPDQR